MIACYCRISTQDQKTDNQKAEMKRWLRGHTIELADGTWCKDIEWFQVENGPAIHDAA